MSMTGFAASPGTDVEPACSIRNASLPSARRMRSASPAKNSGHCGS
jgi:hypothetical protein